MSDLTDFGVEARPREIRELKWAEYTHVSGFCDICGCPCAVRPCVYQGHLLKLCWEDMWRIEEGMPPLEWGARWW